MSRSHLFIQFLAYHIFQRDMAEVLGVVASGISVASFAIQLADSIKKLEKFVDNVRDAPEDIKYTIH